MKVPHTRDSFSPIGFVFFEVNATSTWNRLKRTTAYFSGAGESHGKKVLGPGTRLFLSSFDATENLSAPESTEIFYDINRQSSILDS